MILFVALTFLLGCAPTSQYEYRYRVFYSADIPSRETLTSEEFSRLFYPLGSLNRSLDLFGEEGFTLHDYYRVGESRNYVFVFRRSGKKAQTLKRSSRHLDGIYQIDKDNSKLLLAVSTDTEDAQIVELEGIKKIYSAQTGNREVAYDTPEGRASLIVSEDESVELVIETLSGDATITKRYPGRKIGQPDDRSK